MASNKAKKSIRNHFAACGGSANLQFTAQEHALTFLELEFIAPFGISRLEHNRWLRRSRCLRRNRWLYHDRRP